MEEFKTPENLPTREMVVEVLINRGKDDPEAKEILLQYVVAQEKISESLGGEYPHEELAIHMAEIYFDANYREYAIESLDEMEILLLINEDIYKDLLQKLREIRKRMIESE